MLGVLAHGKEKKASVKAFGSPANHTAYIHPELMRQADLPADNFSIPVLGLSTQAPLLPLPALLYRAI